MLVSIGLLAIGLALLVLGGEFLVRSAIVIGKWCKLSDLVVGLTIVALGTSAPEIAVSVRAALVGAPEIAITNVVGSNFANIMLVLAFSAAMLPIVVDREVALRDITIMLLSYGYIIFALQNGVISQIEGVLGFAALVIYIIYMIRLSRKQHVHVMEHESEAAIHTTVEETVERVHAPWVVILLLVSGVALLAIGGRLLVSSAVEIAELLGVSQAVIGVSIVAIGTSLPELVASVIAVIKKSGDIAVGNIVGSNIWNTFGALSISAAVKPLEQASVAWNMIWMMVFAALLLWGLSLFAKRIGRASGLSMLAIYFGYQYWLFASV